MAKPRSLYEQIVSKCVHFNGIQHDRCKAGVVYDEVCDRSTKGPARMPCWNDQGTKATCASAKFRTPEEAQAEVDEIERGFAASMDRLKNGECMHCGFAVTRYVQAGHCAYAEPCGHRMGQADAKALNEMIAKLRAPGTPDKEGDRG